MAKDYGHDNLGESHLHFDFSIVDYTGITESQAPNQGSTGAQRPNEFQINN